jgi:hypothetical protein
MNIQKNTAKRMLANIEAELQSLASEQQSMNGDKGGSSTYRCGGHVRRKKMTLGDEVPGPGGYTLKPSSWANLPKMFGQDPYKIDFGLGKLPALEKFDSFNTNFPGQKGNKSNPVALNDNEVKAVGLGSVKMPTLFDNKSLAGLQPNTTSLNGPSTGDNKFDWAGLQAYAPALFNLGAGLFGGKAQVLDPNQFQNQSADKALSMMPSEFRIDPQLNAARNAYANYTRNINNVSNSRGERMANYGSGMNQYNATVGNLYAEKNNQENEMVMRKAMMLNSQGQQRAETKMGVQNMNDQNAAAANTYRMSMLSQVPTSLQQNYLINKQMANQKASQDAYVRALMKMPFFTQWLGLDQLNPLGIKK